MQGMTLEIQANRFTRRTILHRDRPCESVIAAQSS